MTNTTFSLSRPKNKTFPTWLKNNDTEYEINADFRTILKIRRMYDDDNILDRQKPSFAIRWFFREEIPDNGMELLYNFLRQGRSPKEGDEHRPQQFCFEFDAAEIYTSFLMQYQIDLIDVDFLHWYKFLTLLYSLGENTPFRRRIALRFMDTSNLKGTQRTEAEDAKEAVQLPVKYTREELAEINEFEKEWGRL